MSRILPLIGSLGIFWLLFSLVPSAFLATSATATEQRTTSLSDYDLYQIAQSITVKIIVDGRRASGILIKRQDQTYTVLTSSHVLFAGTAFSIQTPDGKTHAAVVIQDGDQQGQDLALLQFGSDQSYTVASLGLKSNLTLNQSIVSAGFAHDFETLVFITGQIALLPTQALENGYQIGYTGNIQQGMSGGPILNKEGEVIGINSLSTYPILDIAYVFEDGSIPSEEQIAEMRRSSWGIPIQTVTQFTSEVKLSTSVDFLNIPIRGGVKDILLSQSGSSPTSNNTSTPSVVPESLEVSPSERYVEEGQEQVEAGTLASAIESYTQAIRLDPTNANAYYWRGQAYYTLKEYDKGIQDLTEAIELIPASESVFIRSMYFIIRAAIKFEKQDYARAIEDFTHAIELENDIAKNIALRLRGRARFELKDYTGTVEDITQSIANEYYQEDLEDYVYRGNAYEALGNTAKAVDDWQKAAQLGFAGQMENIAKKVTVQIGIMGSTPSSFKPEGSGVIIAKQGQTYYVLTCDHVVPDEANYIVKTSDGRHHLVAYDTVSRQSGVDLAILQFRSDENYETATIAVYPDPPNALRYVFTAGWAISGASRTNSTWQFTSGLLFSREATIDATSDSSYMTKGYESVYTNITQVGMSGGAVLDTEGRLIGIHGQSIGGTYEENGEVRSEVEWGNSMGIPIQTFLTLAPEIGIDPALLQISNVAPPPMPDPEQMSSIRLAARAVAFAPQAGDRDDALLWLRRGNRLWRLQGIFSDDSSLVAFDRAIELNPNSYEAWYGRALALEFQSGNHAREAIRSLDRAIELNNSFYLAWVTRGRLLFQMGRIEAALSSFEKASFLNSKEIYAYWFQGLLLAELKRPEEALAAYTQAITNFEITTETSLHGRNSPYASRLYASRGNVRHQLNDRGGAVEDYERAVELSPGTPSNYETLADLYRESGDQIKSIEALSHYFAALADIFEFYQVAADSPTHFVPKISSLYMQGLVQLARGDNSGAIQSLNQAIELGSNFPSDSSFRTSGIYQQTYATRAIALGQLKDYTGAISDLTEAINLCLENTNCLSSIADLYYQRGNTYANLSDYAQAVEDYTRSIELIPENTEPDYKIKAYFERGFAYNSLGQFPLAVEDFTHVIEINPNVAFAYRLRGVAYQNIGNSSNSIEDLQKAAELFNSQGDMANYEQTVNLFQQGQN